MRTLERRVNRVERSLEERQQTRYDRLSDEELDSRIREYEDRILADSDTDALLREAIIYEREHGHGEGRVVAILREDLARDRP